jgi:hypothetical protein
MRRRAVLPAARSPANWIGKRANERSPAPVNVPSLLGEGGGGRELSRGAKQICGARRRSTEKRAIVPAMRSLGGGSGESGAILREGKRRVARSLLAGDAAAGRGGRGQGAGGSDQRAGRPHVCRSLSRLWYCNVQNRNVDSRAGAISPDGGMRGAGRGEGGSERGARGRPSAMGRRQNAAGIPKIPSILSWSATVIHPSNHEQTPPPSSSPPTYRWILRSVYFSCHARVRANRAETSTLRPLLSVTSNILRLRIIIIIIIRIKAGGGGAFGLPVFHNGAARENGISCLSSFSLSCFSSLLQPFSFLFPESRPRESPRSIAMNSRTNPRSRFPW